MNIRTTILDLLTVLSSFGTLLCCAVPALLVSVGAGAVMASVVSAIPQLVWISVINLRLINNEPIPILITFSWPSRIARLAGCLR
jgi:type III secretory pathway component EscV